MKMDILEIEKLRQSYLKNTQKVVDTLVYEIRVRQNDMEVMIAERDRQIEELKKENAGLSRKINKLCAELATANKELSQLRSKSDGSNNVDRAGEADSQESIPAEATQKQEKAQKSQRYTIATLVELIANAFRKSDKKSLKESFDYLLDNNQRYKNKLDHQSIQILLCIGYFNGYDKLLINKYDEIKAFVTCHQSKLYQLLANERQTHGYKVVDQCLAEYMRREGAPIAGLDRDNASYLKKRLKEIAMPCIDKLYEQMGYGVCLHSNKHYKRKRVWMKNTKMNQYVGFEATYCSKCNRYYISPLDIKKLNEYLAPYQISTINDTPLNSKNEYKESNLNTTSVLKQMGYETTKSREERWRLLNQVIIPKLGKAKVTNHLKFLIRLHGSRPQMANAVFEWQYDLSRLQR